MVAETTNISKKAIGATNFGDAKHHPPNKSGVSNDANRVQ